MYTWGYIKDATLAKLDLDENEATVQNLLSRFPFYANEVMTQVCSTVKPKHTFAKFIITADEVNTIQKMPDDFVSFGDDICMKVVNRTPVELHDNDYFYHGYNEVLFFEPGEYYISYNARWLDFGKNMDDDFVLDIPRDILDCIPSYIASQCYKIDDLTQSQIYRNEYEMLFARIDDTNYKMTKTLVIDGGW